MFDFSYLYAGEIDEKGAGIYPNLQVEAGETALLLFHKDSRKLIHSWWIKQRYLLTFAEKGLNWLAITRLAGVALDMNFKERVS